MSANFLIIMKGPAVLPVPQGLFIICLSLVYHDVCHNDSLQ